MFIESECYMVSVSEPLDLTMVFYLKNILSKEGIRSATRLYEAIRSHISTYWSEGFTITQIICDGEAGFKALINDFLRMGIKLTVSGPNRHGVPKVDRKIRLIKDRLRCIVHDLPYTLPFGLLSYAVYYVVSRINMIRHSDATSTVLSPREQFIGRRTDYNIDLNISFGDYVETDSRMSDNSLNERTESCLALLPTGNQNGSVKFFSIRSQRIITRERWRIVKITSEVIQQINIIALRHKKMLDDNMRVERGLRRVIIEEEPDEINVPAQPREQPLQIHEQVDQTDVGDADGGDQLEGVETAAEDVEDATIEDGEATQIENSETSTEGASQVENVEDNQVKDTATNESNENENSWRNRLRHNPRQNQRYNFNTKIVEMIKKHGKKNNRCNMEGVRSNDIKKCVDYS